MNSRVCWSGKWGRDKATAMGRARAVAAATAWITRLGAGAGADAAAGASKGLQNQCEKKIRAWWLKLQASPYATSDTSAVNGNSYRQPRFPTWFEVHVNDWLRSTVQEGQGRGHFTSHTHTVLRCNEACRHSVLASNYIEQCIHMAGAMPRTA